MIENALELDPQLIHKLSKYGIKKHFVIGDVIIAENSFMSSIPIIIDGILKVIKTDEAGKEMLLYYINPSESCIMSLLGGMHGDSSKINAIVEKEATILFLPIEKFHYFIKEYPQWLSYIFKLYHKRYEELLEIINAIAFQKIDERLMELLKKKQILQNSDAITTTHEQLANELGSARVVISRLLKRLEDENKVILGRNKITLL